MNDTVYGKWGTFRMCNGHGANAGKWSVMRQESKGADIEIAQRPSGGNVAYVSKKGAEDHATLLNGESVPYETNLEERHPGIGAAIEELRQKHPTWPLHRIEATAKSEFCSRNPSKEPHA